MRDAIDGLGSNQGLANALKTLDDSAVGQETRELIENFKSSLDTYHDDFENFIGYRQHLRNGGRRAQLTDFKGNLFSKRKWSIFRVSASQSLAVSGASVGIQLGTMQILRQIYLDNPSLIPREALDAGPASAASDPLPPLESVGLDLNDIRAAVSALSPAQLIGLAGIGRSNITDEELSQIIDGIVKPASTYIDETQASVPEILLVEGATGFFRGLALAAADGRTEALLRERQVQSALRNETSPRSWWTVAKETAATSGKSQLLGQGVSLAVMTAVSGISQALRGEEFGKVAVEFLKNVAFATMSGATMTAIDTVRKACPGFRDIKGAGAQQATKAGMRIVFRIGLQYVKTGLALASGSKLPAGLIWNSRNLMQAGVGGITKEAFGAIVQTLVAKLMPPDDRLRQSLSRTLGSTSQLRNHLVTLEHDMPEELNRSRLEAIEALNTAIKEVCEADQLNNESEGIQRKWEKYKELLDGPQPQTQMFDPDLERGGPRHR